MKWIIYALAPIFLFGCSENGVRLTAEELRLLLDDGFSANFSAFRHSGHIKILPDGTTVLNIPGVGKDSGTWWVAEDQACSIWNKLRDGETICTYFSKRTDGSFVAVDPITGANLGTFRTENSK